ncbi:MAG TPA: hypothetical protein VFW45_07605, partial [Candidatus Polarisedimenticolia bacterium]|nr:hypothetical protein [Candidatus Polarisedimenticolia bacterium]
MDFTEGFNQTEQKLLKSLYRYEDHAVREGMRALARSQVVPPGMMFLYFDYDKDPRSGKFVNPLDVVPTLKADSKYQLDL